MYNKQRKLSESMTHYRDEVFSDMTKEETSQYIKLMEIQCQINISKKERERLMKKNRDGIDTFFSNKFLVNGL